jgi:hypothetical protein
MTPKMEERSWAEFLDSLSEHGIITEACHHSGISRQQLRKRRNTDPDFEAAYQEAYELGTEAIEDEATKRATKGTNEPVFWKGRRIATVRKKSDLLLMFILKKRRPEFRDNYAPQTTPEDHELDYSPREQIARRIAQLTARNRTNSDIIDVE